MKQRDIVKAFHVIEKYAQKDLPLKVSYALFKVKNAIKDQVEFQLEKENEIYQKYKPVPQDDGSLKFESQDQAKEFAVEFGQKIDEVADMDVELDGFKKPRIPLDQLVDFSVQDIEDLEPFIEFTE